MSPPTKSVPAERRGNDGFRQSTQVSEELSTKLRRRRFMSEGDQNKHCFVNMRGPQDGESRAVAGRGDAADRPPEAEGHGSREVVLGSHATNGSHSLKGRESDLAGRSAEEDGKSPKGKGPADEGTKAPEVAEPRLEALEEESAAENKAAKEPPSIRTRFYNLEVLDKHSGLAETPPSRSPAPTLDAAGAPGRWWRPLARAACLVLTLVSIVALTCHDGVRHLLTAPGAAEHLHELSGGRSTSSSSSSVRLETGEPDAAPVAADRAQDAHDQASSAVAEEFGGNPDCWADGFTFDACCSKEHGVGGNAACWDSVFNFQRCCTPKDQH
eukprot:CAMPEP_0204586908 /NCGR_PEP_ID=MMETSP0661-20131031/47759_1 /ASSEMBLY_ACC=CAM_ASM_000606 /TAXON_ID=109239 /ORGANISM="Alexandrium margalefi, Strain AMGDE01CS-322" /LENGTH=326 /DNA_ID=CAMNT_0051596589 /DNA_START=67 /DNA_END=1047 /DNA_ORIENTATION=+